MVREINHDTFFLGQKSEPATEAEFLTVAADGTETAATFDGGKITVTASSDTIHYGNEVVTINVNVTDQYVANKITVEGRIHSPCRRTFREGALRIGSLKPV